VAQRSVAFASVLRQAGLGDGDHAALLCRNRVEVFEVVLGSLLAGVWLTPVNWHLARAEMAQNRRRVVLAQGEQEGRALLQPLSVCRAHCRPPIP